MAQALEGVFGIGIRCGMGYGPGHGRLQIGRCLRRVQPALVVGNDRGRAHQPDAGLVLFHQHLAARVLLAQRNLAVGADDLDGGRVCSDGHHETPWKAMHDIIN